MFPDNLHGDEEIHGEFPFTLKIHRLKGTVPAHVHHFIEYTYAIKGRGTERINGVEKELAPGTFTLLFPHQVHEIDIPPGEELVLYVGAIGLKAFFGAGDSFLTLHRLLKDAENDVHSTYALDDATAGGMLPLLHQMYDEIREEKPWSRTMFLAKLTQLFVLFERYRLERMERCQEGYSGMQRRGMWEVIHYVYQNFKEDITLEMLAERFSYSVPYISAAFKQAVGENYYSFLERNRTAHACNLLIGTDMKITDVAYEAGFKSYPTFVRVFQARMGMSPTAYRKREYIALT
ncbi:AraC family transcriptional regulator [Paenibacillus dendritiformis]|uniref:AraC family transcriptional regulator n=1 Tax=Paenibacillus dendritiformis TaxID=130049 RepID=UPI0018CD6A3B|nr:AraC family transcriptional regulator [Paenibacillus dendritiformis]MBG9791533.1 AraC family transcriptional regulator [Paenibacillus dendritiformis]